MKMELPLLLFFLFLQLFFSTSFSIFLCALPTHTYIFFSLLHVINNNYNLLFLIFNRNRNDFLRISSAFVFKNLSGQNGCMEFMFFVILFFFLFWEESLSKFFFSFSFFFLVSFVTFTIN